MNYKRAFFLAMFSILGLHGAAQGYSIYDDETSYTCVSFPGYDIFIDSFFVYEMRVNSYGDWDTNHFTIDYIDTNVCLVALHDTLWLNEGMDYPVDNRVVQFRPHEPNVKFKVSYSVQQSLIEQYDPKRFWFGYPDPEDRRCAEEEWDFNRVKWSGASPYKTLKVSTNNTVELPEFNWHAYEVVLKKEMGLRDTMLDYSGESDNIATVVYKEKPCLHFLDYVLLKIEHWVGDKRKDVRYLVINFSYGC